MMGDLLSFILETSGQLIIGFIVAVICVNILLKVGRSQEDHAVWPSLFTMIDHIPNITRSILSKLTRIIRRRSTKYKENQL